MANSQENTTDSNDFAHTAQQGQAGPVREFLDFLRYNKKWWITPIVIVLLLVAILVILGGNPAIAPFIYPLM